MLRGAYPISYTQKIARKHIRVLWMQILVIIPLRECCVASVIYEKLKNCKKEYWDLYTSISSLIKEASSLKVVS